jgi:hypothetical protein
MKQAIKFFIIVCTIVLLISCTPNVKNTGVTETPVPSITTGVVVTNTQPPAKTASVTASPTVTHTPTPMPADTLTPSPSPTKTVSPSVTPTFDIASVMTNTPASPARCPVEDPDLLPEIEITFENSCSSEVSSYIAKYLNAGGNPEKLLTHLEQEQKGIWDLTGDGIPEVLTFVCYLHIYTCDDGAYTVVAEISPGDGIPPNLIKVTDMNLDGTAELLVQTSAGAADMFYEVLGWDGSQFINLVTQPDFESPFRGGVYYGQFVTSGVSEFGRGIFSTWDAIDTDNNGTIEIVFRYGLPAGLYDGGPWRAETDIYMWNGAGYVLDSIKIDPPQYRFQAVQDADDAFLNGEYNQAYDLYDQVIFNEALDWWSKERAIHETERYYAEFWWGNSTPTPLPSNDHEFGNLAAYAYYRIMLLHIVTGSLPEAERIYETLIDKFPVGQEGYAYAEMATEFWHKYKISYNLQQACEKAIKYAEVNGERILGYLGSDYHGFQSRTYQPEDVCPLK